MNYAQKIKENLNIGSKEPVRAVIYARVSTDSEGQKESCANQVDLAMSYISNHSNITLVGTFVDDGISGKNDFSRPQYGEMMQLLTSGGFDLIITKALSRLNRDEYNSLVLTNQLIVNEATILTLEDNQIHDFEDLNSGLLHSINYAIDAQYVKRQSISARKTQELRCKNKILTAKDCSYGYVWNSDTKTININEEEADVVRYIFEEYVYRNGTPASIERLLKEKDISISNRSISNIIKDERYIGSFYINKRSSILGTGQKRSKRFFLPKEQWVLIPRPDLQIVDTELFNMAQRLHNSRITMYEKPDKNSVQARFQGKHLYAGKIFCPVCGKPYQFTYADRAKVKPVYKIKSHSECPNPVRCISEADIQEITRQALKQIIEQQSTVLTSLEAILIECVEASQNSYDEINSIKKQISTKENKIENLLDALTEGGLTPASKERIKTKINNINEEINKLNDLIANKENNKLSISYVTDKVNDIKNAINELRNFNVIDRERVQNYIERIELPENGDINIFLTSGQIITLNTQQTSDFQTRENVVKKGNQDARQ